MTILSFTLNPDGVARLHDALTCLAKFSEIVGLDARPNGLVLSALNSSKSAYASCSFDKTSFFSSYRFSPGESTKESDKFGCQLVIKSLLSVFKGKFIDARDRETAIERCEVNLLEPPESSSCRLVAQMICRHGVKKTYKLTYEVIENLRPIFEKDSSNNHWTISSQLLKAFSEFFGARTENLDFFYDNNHLTLTSYTEKITNGKEILKQPLQTSVTIDGLDFEHIDVEEQVHIGISVKDFRSIVLHAESVKASVKAIYSDPSRPMQLSYSGQGVDCEYTLMTTGEFRGSTTVSANGAARASSSFSRAKLATRTNAASTAHISRSATESVLQRSAEQGEPHAKAMPPPLYPASKSFTTVASDSRANSMRVSPPPPQASINHESLFVRDDDDDERRWNEPGSEDDNDNDAQGLTWDASFDRPSNSLRPTRLRSGRAFRAKTSDEEEEEEEVPPTQRLSQVRGLFD